jgi:hypothetical protein
LGTCQFFFLSFIIGSYLVSNSLRKVWLVLRFWRSALWPTSRPALELGFHCVGLLGACFFALCPFSGARSEIHQPALCCQRVMLVCCFSILQHCLTLGVAHWLKRWALWTAMCPISGIDLSSAHCRPFCLSSHLFTESLCGDQLLAPPLFSGVLRTPSSLCCMLLFTSLFII